MSSPLSLPGPARKLSLLQTLPFQFGLPGLLARELVFGNTWAQWTAGESPGRVRRAPLPGGVT